MIIAGSSLTITIAISEDIGAGTATISFRNANDTGTWAATVVDPETGKIQVSVTPADLSVIGTWTIWATYTLEDGRTLKTPAKQFTVYAEGTVQQ